jgi:putative ABC transport system permease protein
MLYRLIIISLRNLRRNRLFSVINIAGLAVGLAACLLIGLYFLHEKSFDAFLPQADRICAVALDLKMQQEEGITTNTPPPLGLRLGADFPEVELAARSFFLQKTTVRVEKPDGAPVMFTENTAYAVDSTFLELFGFPMAEGDARTALNRPGSLVLSQQAADKYFGRNAPIGQALRINERLFTVTGVAKNLPANSTVQFDFLLPIADFKVVDRFAWSWIWLQVDTWVRLREQASPQTVAALEAKLPAMVRTHAPAAFERVGQDFEAQMQRGDRYNVRLLPLKTLHLGQPALASRLATLGDDTQVRTFGAVGVLILLLACINFMNLSTARSSVRAREVGVRKVLGSQRQALVGQFLIESLIFSTVAALAAFVLASAALPIFNRLTELEMPVSALFTAKILGLTVGLSLFAGVLGGLYPAFVLSRFTPLTAFKGQSAALSGGLGGLRSSLVVFQFSVSIALMLGSWAVLRQLDFARSNSPGLQRENVLLLPVDRNINDPEKLASFRRQVAEMPEVQEACQATFVPGVGSFGDFYEPEQGTQSRPVVQNLPIASFLTDTRFVPVLGLELIAGRNFMDDATRIDSTSVILNEAAVKAIGWDNPVGQWMRYPGNENQRFQVVGVVRDFHFDSVRDRIQPMAIFHQSSKTYYIASSLVAARIKPGTAPNAVRKAEAVWGSMVPNAPFTYDFLDAAFARLYRSEAKMGSVLSLLTGLALFIGCLGLFALAAFMAERRTKEIGIRKVLGASIAAITGLLAKDFLKLVLIAIALASPVAYYGMNQWLSDFAYRIDVPWWMFAAAGGAAVAIAFLTVAGQAIRAALANPVESLRSE